MDRSTYTYSKCCFDSPVFICGYPKSGTTLMVSLLDGHRDLLVIPEETKFFTMVFPKDFEKRFDALFRDTNIAAIQRGIVDEPSGLRDYREVNFEFLRASARDYWENSQQNPKHLLECLAYGFSEVTGKDDFLHWVEKTPGNENYLKQITEWWPKSLAIFMVRDPRQAFCSHREYQKKKPRPSKIPLNRFLRNWEKSVRSFQRYLADGGKGLVIRYEDFIRDPRSVMNEVAEFLGISFNECLLYPTRAGIKWKGNAALGKDFQGVNANPQNYLQKLSEMEIEIIEVSLGKLMKQFDYQCIMKFSYLKVVYAHIIRYIVRWKSTISKVIRG